MACQSGPLQDGPSAGNEHAGNSNSSSLPTDSKKPNFLRSRSQRSTRSPLVSSTHQNVLGMFPLRLSISMALGSFSQAKGKAYVLTQFFSVLALIGAFTQSCIVNIKLEASREPSHRWSQWLEESSDLPGSLARQASAVAGSCINGSIRGHGNRVEAPAWHETERYGMCDISAKECPV